MRKMQCQECGKHYDYDVDEFCPRCGAYNSPAQTNRTELERELLARFRPEQLQRPAPHRQSPFEEEIPTWKTRRAEKAAAKREKARTAQAAKPPREARKPQEPKTPPRPAPRPQPNAYAAPQGDSRRDRKARERVYAAAYNEEYGKPKGGCLIKVIVWGLLIWMMAALIFQVLIPLVFQLIFTLVG